MLAQDKEFGMLSLFHLPHNPPSSCVPREETSDAYDCPSMSKTQNAFHVLINRMK